MRTGIGSSAYFTLYDYEAGLRTARLHGYDCIDFQCFNREESELFRLSDQAFERILAEICECAREVGIEFYQSHAPWWHICGKEKIPFYEKAIYGVSLMGIHHMAIHPVTDFGVTEEDEQTMRRVHDYNLSYFSQLIPCAGRYGVKLCIENLPALVLGLARVPQVKRLVTELHSPCIGACLDTGHAQVYGDDIRADIRLLGSDLKLLHVHDNVQIWNDEHLLPYQGTIDWNAFYQGLREIGFDGVMSLELSTPYVIPQPFHERFHRYAAGLARYMAQQV